MTTGGMGADQEFETRPIVAWGRTASRLRRLLSVLAVAVVAAWAVTGFLSGGFSIALLTELAGIGILIAIAGEFVVVGGSALRGMFTAGARGDRLASPDVSLLPPQVTRRLRR